MRIKEITLELPKVRSISTAVIERDFRPELAVKGAKTTHSRSSYLLVCITLDDGTRGFGEMSGTKNWSGEDAVSARDIIKNIIAPYLQGKSPLNILEHSRKIEFLVNGNTFTRASVNMALWDVVGKCLNLPVYELLGGKMRDRIPIKISISGDGANLKEGIAAATKSGFKSFKVKVGHGREHDLPRFALARQVLGSETFIGADANCGWDLDEANYCVPKLVENNVAFIEQPVGKAAWSEMRILRKHGKPILADESVFGFEDAEKCIAEQAADGISIYVGKSGSLENAFKIGELCANSGLDVVVGSNAELGIGTAAQIHLAASLPKLGRFPSDIIGQHFYLDGTLEEENEIDGQYAYVGVNPGLGVSPRPELMRELT